MIGNTIVRSNLLLLGRHVGTANASRRNTSGQRRALGEYPGRQQRARAGGGAVVGGFGTVQAQLLSRRLGARSTLSRRTRTIRSPTLGAVIIELRLLQGRGRDRDDYRRFFAARGRRFEPRGLYSSSSETQSDGGSSIVGVAAPAALRLLGRRRARWRTHVPRRRRGLRVRVLVGRRHVEFFVSIRIVHVGGGPLLFRW